VCDVLSDGLGASLGRPLGDGRCGSRGLAIRSTRASVGIALVVPGGGSGQTKVGCQVHVSAGLHLERRVKQLLVSVNCRLSINEGLKRSGQRQKTKDCFRAQLLIGK
jgi:hypothetical protein